MVAFLAYAGYSIHASAGRSGRGQSGLAKDKGAVVQDIVTAGVCDGGWSNRRITRPVPGQSQTGRRGQRTQISGRRVTQFRPASRDRQGLKLDATFLQGRDEMAIINGRVYSKGHYLIIDANSGKSSSRLFVVSVLPAKVVLRGGTQITCWVIPTSSLCPRSRSTRRGSAPAKPRIGNPGQAAPRSHRSRGVRAATAAARTGNP